MSRSSLGTDDAGAKIKNDVVHPLAGIPKDVLRNVGDHLTPQDLNNLAAAGAPTGIYPYEVSAYNLSLLGKTIPRSIGIYTSLDQRMRNVDASHVTELTTHHFDFDVPIVDSNITKLYVKFLYPGNGVQEKLSAFIARFPNLRSLTVVAKFSFSLEETATTAQESFDIVSPPKLRYLTVMHTGTKNDLGFNVTSGDHLKRIRNESGSIKLEEGRWPRLEEIWNHNGRTCNLETFLPALHTLGGFCFVLVLRHQPRLSRLFSTDFYDLEILEPLPAVHELVISSPNERGVDFRMFPNLKHLFIKDWDSFDLRRADVDGIRSLTNLETLTCEELFPDARKLFSESVNVEVVGKKEWLKLFAKRTKREYKKQDDLKDELYRIGSRVCESFEFEKELRG